MELKDFVKTAISDITDAIAECQKELENGSYIAPTVSRSTPSKIETKEGNLFVSNIDFEVSVIASTNESSNGKTKKGIEVCGSVLGISIKGGIGSKSIGDSCALSNENITKIRFSIPVIYPSVKVKEKLSAV